MEESNGREEAVEHLHEALAVEDADAKNFHVRQALQLLDVEGE